MTRVIVFRGDDINYDCRSKNKVGACIKSDTAKAMNRPCIPYKGTAWYCS